MQEYPGDEEGPREEEAEGYEGKEIQMGREPAQYFMGEEGIGGVGMRGGEQVFEVQQVAVVAIGNAALAVEFLSEVVGEVFGANGAGSQNGVVVLGKDGEADVEIVDGVVGGYGAEEAAAQGIAAAEGAYHTAETFAFPEFEIVFDLYVSFFLTGNDLMGAGVVMNLRAAEAYALVGEHTNEVVEGVVREDDVGIGEYEEVGSALGGQSVDVGGFAAALLVVPKADVVVLMGEPGDDGVGVVVGGIGDDAEGDFVMGIGGVENGVDLFFDDGRFVADGHENVDGRQVGGVGVGFIDATIGQADEQQAEGIADVGKGYEQDTYNIYSGGYG